MKQNSLHSPDFQNKSRIYYCFIAIILLVFILLFETSTSPLYENIHGYDSAYFRYIGSAILKGKVPYRDLWDNKGPVLFFIQAVGALTGVHQHKILLIFPLQFASLLITVFFLEKADREMNAGIKKRLLRFTLFTFCAMPVFAAVIEGGNLSEEWSLPMISCSLYFFIKYAAEAENHHSYAHPPRYAFIHGLCFGLIAFIRFNNIISICAGLFVTALILIAHRQWKNILQNILFGLLGIAVIAVPVCAWFITKHALKDMLYAAFLSGLKYVKTEVHSELNAYSLVIRYLPLLFCLVIILIHIIREHKCRLLDIFMLTIIGTNGIMLISFNIYLHYFLLFFPVFFLTLLLYVNIPSAVEILMIIVQTGFFLMNCNNLFHEARVLNQHLSFPTANYYFPRSERDSMIAIDTRADIYLLSGMTPVSRFAAYQSIHLFLEPEFYEEFKTDITTKEPKWIITPCKAYDFPFVNDLLDKKYLYRFNDDFFCFYQIRDLSTEP